MKVAQRILVPEIKLIWRNQRFLGTCLLQLWYKLEHYQLTNTSCQTSYVLWLMVTDRKLLYRFISKLQVVELMLISAFLFYTVTLVLLLSSIT